MTSANERPEIHKTMIRLDKGLHDALVEAAETEGRNINQQIAFYVRQCLEESGYIVAPDRRAKNGRYAGSGIA